MTLIDATLRHDYLEICEGDACAALILDLFQRWSYGKRQKRAEAWIYKKRTELKSDLMDLFGLNKVSAALIKLRGWGYLQCRNNPHNGQDKTLQYKVDQDAIDEILALLGQTPDNLKEGSERLNLNVEPPILMLSDSESLTETLSDRQTEQTPTPPARAYEAQTAGVVAIFKTPEADGELIQKTLPAAEARDAQDEHEAYAFQVMIASASAAIHPPSVPPVSPLLDPDAETRDDSSSPTWMDGVLIGMDGEIGRWLRDDRERLRAWCEYATMEKLGGGFVRTQMRLPKYWPPKHQARTELAADPVAWASAIKTSEYADFVMS